MPWPCVGPLCSPRWAFLLLFLLPPGRHGSQPLDRVSKCWETLEKEERIRKTWCHPVPWHLPWMQNLASPFPPPCLSTIRQGAGTKMPPILYTGMAVFDGFTIPKYRLWLCPLTLLHVSALGCHPGKYFPGLAPSWCAPKDMNHQQQQQWFPPVNYPPLT